MTGGFNMLLKSILFAIIIFSILSISAVSAEDSNNISLSYPSSEINYSLNSNNYVMEFNESSNLSPGTFDDLQMEINNASAGSVLDLYGDYNGYFGSRVDLSKDLTIDGHGHTINCLSQNGCSAFYSNSGNIILKNLRIINGYNDYTDCGGAIYITGVATYTIENCTFEKNWADDYGGAIYNGASNRLTIKNCIFTSNMVDDCDGGAVYSKGDLLIVNSTFQFNKAYVDGGAIFSCGNVNIDSSLFLSNKADGARSQCYGGAIRSNGNVDVENSTFKSNHAHDYGGAIYANNVYINFNQKTQTLNSFFIENYVDDDNGGAIYADDSLNAKNTEFLKNHAKVDGGAVFTCGNTFVTHCLFVSNNAGGAKSKCYGGAIRSKNSVYINNCTFEENSADNHGGAVYSDIMSFSDSPSYFIGNHVNKGSGGAIYSNKFSDSVIMHLTFRDNHADSPSSDGGAIYINDECYISFEQCTFVSNHCGDEGGAIYLDDSDSKLTLLNNVFIANDADDEGQSVYNCGYYQKINNNYWGGINPTSSNNQLIMWRALRSNCHEIDSDPLNLNLKVDVDYNNSKPIIKAEAAFYFSNGSYYNGNLYDIDMLSFIIMPNLKVISQEKNLNKLSAIFSPTTIGKYNIMANFYDFYTLKEVNILKVN